MRLYSVKAGKGFEVGCVFDVVKNPVAFGFWYAQYFGYAHVGCAVDQPGVGFGVVAGLYGTACVRNGKE